MNIKKLNEKLSKLLEDGFALSGKRDEVTDIISKLSQEYGDLTIPEFIDMLIEKEKNGEEILDESLSENPKLLTSKYSKFKKVPGGNLGTFEGEILGQPVRYAIDIYMGLSSDVSYYWEKLENAGYKEQIRLGTKGAMADMLIYIPKPVKSAVCHPCYFIYDVKSNTWKQKCPCGWLNNYLNYWTSLKFSSEEITEKEAEVWLSDYIKESPLEKLRKKTSQNIKTKNTTVKQALSKSAVAKKIRELQNPTPEKLAKILAAIEE